MKTRIDSISQAMMTYYQGDPRRVHHFLKVHSFARLIGEMEKLDAATQEIVEITALVHDIGIKLSEEKYGSASGKYQELEGPAEARKLLESIDIEAQIIDRVCWLVGHHHTYKAIEGMDYQILVEADFLVNAYEDGVSKEGIESFRDKIFRTLSGIEMLNQMYLAPVA